MTNLTLREVISQVKIPNKFVNADSKITNKFIYSLLKKHRDTLVRQLDGKFEIYKLSYLFQTWQCVDLIAAPTVDECCGVKTDGIVYRTKLKIPKALTGADGPILGRVTSLDGSVDIFGITPLEWNRKLENTNSKYDKSLYYFYNNGYLYFPNLKWKKIEVQAYFEDDIKKDNVCCGEDPEDKCKTFLDTEFRIPKHLLAACVGLTNEEIFNLYQRLQGEDEQIDKNTNRKN